MISTIFLNNSFHPINQIEPSESFLTGDKQLDKEVRNEVWQHTSWQERWACLRRENFLSPNHRARGLLFKAVKITR